MADLNELTMLADVDKLDLCKSVLDELHIDAVSVNKTSGEIVIPCSITSYHVDQEKNPTAAISFTKLLFHCLGCEASGTLLWFVAETLGLESSDKALDWIKAKAGIKQVMDIEDLLRYFEHVYDRPDQLAIPVYSMSMVNGWAKPDHEYFLERLIPKRKSETFKLGYDEESRRIVIPHIVDGNLIGWQTRQHKGPGPKYKNSTDFPRDSTIFNYNATQDQVIVVESCFSVIRHTYCGWLVDAVPYVFEGTFGANVTDRQIELLAKHDRVYLWFDNDESGWKATESVIERLGRKTDVWVVDYIWKEDPADLPKKEVERLMKFAIPSSLWTRPETVRKFSDFS